MSGERVSQPTAFTGTALYYARHRPPYPEHFLSDLRALARTTGHGALLDLACGPGRIAIPMAPYFTTVLAVDIEAEMIAVAEQEARGRADNIEWRLARAEDLQLPASSLELITIGEAFHRLDGKHVLQRAMQWLRPGGSVASLAGESIWRGPEPWKKVLVGVVNAWTGNALGGDPNQGDWHGPIEDLRGAGFDVRERQSTIAYTWTCDSLVGFMFSTSIASRRVLGTNADRFEAELRAALLDVERSGRFACRQRFGFTLGTK